MGSHTSSAKEDATNNTSNRSGRRISLTTPTFSISRIAVIGAGPSGLAAAKHLLAEGFSSSEIDIYEQQAEVGGVWNYSSAVRSSSIPQTDAHVGLDAPLYPDNAAANGGIVAGGQKDIEEDEKDEYEDYEFDSDDEACTAPGSGACSLPSITSSRKDKNKDEERGERHMLPPIFPNPMYDDLHTNIPHTLMRYSDLGFSTTVDEKEGGRKNGTGTHEDSCEIFPTRQVVLEYLIQYAREVRHLVRFSTQVTDVSLQKKTTQAPNATEKKERENQESIIRDKWTLQSKNLLTNTSHTETYDAVVVASGHYSTPFIPVPTTTTQEEMQAFVAAHPGVLSHSKSYRAASAFAGKRVVIVGSGPSGLDIASQISAVCASPLIISARSALSEETAGHLGVGVGNSDSRVRVVGRIKKFLVEERGIIVGSAPSSTDISSDKKERKKEGEEEEDRGEERITDIDAIIFCTGYLYTYPFLSSLSSSSSSSSPPLITNGRRVHNLARHFLHTSHPTLVFPGLPIKVIPFP